MPRSLVAPRNNELAWREYDEPALGSGQVRVRCEFGAAKHGTELAFFSGKARVRGPFDEALAVHRKPEGEPKPSGEMPLGNMAVGRVIEVADDVDELKVDQRVCGYISFRQTQVAPAKHLRPMDEAMDWRSAVCLDPAVFALAAVRDGHVRIGDATAVFGLGAIGLVAVQLLRLSGASAIIAVDPLAARREIAMKLGATLALDPTQCDAGLEIKKATAKRGADVVIEYSGSVHAMQAAIRGVAFGGNVVAGAFPGPYPAGLDLGAEAHMNIPNIIFSRACSDPNREHPRWDEARITETCWALLASGQISGEHIVQPVVPFEQLKEEYAKMAANPQDYVKLGTAFGAAK